MWNFLMRVNKNLVLAIPLAMLAGFTYGTTVGQAEVKGLKGLIVPFTFLMVYPMMVTLNIDSLRQGLNWRLQVVTQGLNFLIIPFTAFVLGKLFFSDDQPGLILGLLLAALLPTSGMTISWTGFAKGNMAAAINMTVIGLTLGALLTPWYVAILLGAEVMMDLALVLTQILAVVFLPMAIGYLTRIAFLKNYSAAEFKDRIAPRFPPLSTLGVLGIVFVAMALKAGTLLAEPELLLVILLPLLVLYGINFGISTAVGSLFFPRSDGIALVFGTVMRNLSIALAIAINGFGEAGAQAALVIAVAYIIQVQSAAWYVKSIARFFPGKETEQ